ncbi:flagellar hook-basal body protein [Paenibacillus apiarius]|uniref:Flagellar hook-basal body protein n=1 Tax=Paenibacillus apiarius TaxID=46240 RepID=A0ABT4DVN0_9BACL|nr:flagellar hook-basal body protein [Paenibacillus apiarius]MCY9514215.1 flagellar hook-basal body protein [Paenibacillus apiarius]MCY9520338.1 flagellar hook-basal body protein [Paenibacillus apiarius]MCY9554765.1 flagellar hook-basal body protein [Paenibacillus apiarius]MCY9557382.1 flagellar hook-basal body protein [Paenibacillus apiarius]MCY9682439.1 flagellar hook-basal body protein [Paenibacillus apiarius]
MNQSMIAASVSMNGIQRKLDVIADNVANVNTKGYKRKTATFADVLTTVRQHDADYRLPGRATPMGYTIGYGSRLTSLNRDFTQGSLTQTGVDTDVALQGDAMFEIMTRDGATAWIREGSFQYNIDRASGEKILVTAHGDQVLNSEDLEIRIAPDKELQIDEAGRIFAVKNGEAPEALGSLKLVKAIKPEQLMQTDNNYYVLPPDMDRNTVVQVLNLTGGDRSDPNQPAIYVRQGMLEESNVSLIDEVNELIQAQRAYQLSARALTSGDAMWGLANSLRA